MKKVTLLAIACIYIFSSCHTSLPDEKELSTRTYTVQFHIQPVPEIVSFLSTKSIPGDIPAEPEIPGGSEEVVSTLFTKIEYAVYNNDTAELLRHKQYSEADEENEDFGTFLYDEFTPGNYKVCILAHSANKVSFTDGNLAFETVSDAFYASCEIEIDNPTEDPSVNMLLHRIVSRVTLAATDKVPLQASEFQIKVSGLYNTFNFWKGEAGNNTADYSTLHTFTSADKQVGAKIKHEFYSFVPAANTTINKLSTQTIDINKNILHSRDITSIPIFVNKTTRYNCTLYSPGTLDGTFQLEIEADGAWGPDLNINASTLYTL